MTQNLGIASWPGPPKPRDAFFAPRSWPAPRLASSSIRGRVRCREPITRQRSCHIRRKQSNISPTSPATTGYLWCTLGPEQLKFWTSCETPAPPRSEEHTSELQSRGHLVCRLLLE